MRERGAITVEYALAYTAVIVPLTFGIMYTAQMLWIWHSVGEWTRDAARYAATHCWQSSADNVTAYMRSHVPPMVDAEQFRGGSVDLAVTYFGKDPETGLPTPFTCDGECSTLCIPETVTVSVRNYEFRSFLTYLGLAPIPIPDFQTTVHMEGAGCDPELALCNP